jgi:DNA invertase Pin-like site-specific DNA recombinase
VSTLDKQTNENQVPVLIDYAKTRGWEVDVYEEMESTRRTLPVKANLLQLLRQGKYEGVIVVRMDRWGRSLKSLVLELDELFKKNIKFISIAENISFGTAQSRMHYQLLAVFCEYERAIISERTRVSLARISKTKKLGRPVGARDKKKRKTDGYLLREYNKKIARAKKGLPNNSEHETLTL